MDQRTTEESLGASAPSDSAGAGIKHEAARLMQVGGTSFGMVSDLGQLAAAEVFLTVKTLPKLAGLAILLLPIAFLTWVAFSALTAYFIKYLLESTLAGFVVFFLCQLFVLAACLMLMKGYSKQLGVPRTKAQAKAVFETLKNEFTG